MEDNEDQPEDVKKATPVEEEIANGSEDHEKASKRKKPKSAPAAPSEPEAKKGKKCSYREKSPPKSKMKKPCHRKVEIICRDNLTRKEYSAVLAAPKKNYSKSPCRKPKPQDESLRSSRERSSGGGYLNRRIEELARPPAHRLMNLLGEYGDRIRPEVIDGILQSVEEKCTLTPEQMEAYYADKEKASFCRRQRKRKKSPHSDPDKRKTKRKTKCDDNLDKEAVCQEFEMAQKFMRHIIEHINTCQEPREAYYDIMEAVLVQLGHVLDYAPSGDADRRFQMMCIVADGIACWIHKINGAVEEKLEKQKVAEESEEEEEEEEEERKGEVILVADKEEDEEDEDEGEEEDEKEKEKRKEEQERKGAVDGEEENGKGAEEGEEKAEEEHQEGEADKQSLHEDQKADEDKEVPLEEEVLKKKEQEEPEKTNEEEQTQEEGEKKGQETTADKDASENAKDDEKTESSPTVKGDSKEEEQKKDDTVIESPAKEEKAKEVEEEEEKQIADEEPKTDEPKEKDEKEEDPKNEQVEVPEVKEEKRPDEKKKEPEQEVETVERTISKVESDAKGEPQAMISNLGEGDLFKTDIPFLTLAKVMDVCLNFLDKREEAEISNTRRRLQNAVLKKLTDSLKEETPGELDANTKAVLEVLAENIAVFLDDMMSESQVALVDKMVPEVESKEIRNWGRWLEDVMDRANDWGSWIHETVEQAAEKAETQPTRGDWADWTNTIDSEALRWRLFNLDTLHRMHHADLNLTQKNVVHTGQV